MFFFTFLIKFLVFIVRKGTKIIFRTRKHTQPIPNDIQPIYRLNWTYCEKVNRDRFCVHPTPQKNSKLVKKNVKSMPSFTHHSMLKGYLNNPNQHKLFGTTEEDHRILARCVKLLDSISTSKRKRNGRTGRPKKKKRKIGDPCWWCITLI